MSDSVANQIKKIVAYIKKGRPTRKEVILGPVVLRPEGASIASQWYFIFIHEDKDARIIALGSDERDLAALFRTKLIEALRTANFIAHDFDDDLAVAQMAEALWPSERTRRVHAQLKAELAERLTEERLHWGVDALMSERPLTAAEIIMFGLDAKEAERFFAIDFAVEMDGPNTKTEYFQKIDVDIGEGEPVPVVQPYTPP